MILGENDPAPAEGPVRKASRPIQEALDQKRWDLERMDRAWGKSGTGGPLFDFVTLGMSRKTPEEAVGILKRPVFACDVLVDVRNNPFSLHQPAWNKKNLQAVCSYANLAYQHRPELGVPKDIRSETSSGRMSDEMFNGWYDANVLAGANLDFLKALMAEHRPAFLCTELGPTFCHRHRIALYLEKELGLTGYDI